MRNRVKEITVLKPAVDSCHHFWMIEVANGPKSRGECKHCGATKEFYNAFPDFNPMKPMKRGTNPLTLPELPEVEVDEESKS
jgi:hypothetical protein